MEGQHCGIVDVHNSLAPQHLHDMYALVEAADWQKLTKELMRIRWAKKPPQNAYSAIFYRGNWFYIDDSDLTSKSTFSLLMQLFALQAGEVKSTGPLLTLPVNR